MTALSNLKFDINDLVKIGGFVVTIMVFRNDLVNEIRQNKVFDQADKQIINYRIEELERCCNVAALKPRDISVPTYKVQ
jgi:hypothetical protein